jgi:hypothetical protein
MWRAARTIQPVFYVSAVRPPDGSVPPTSHNPNLARAIVRGDVVIVKRRSCGAHTG